MLGSAALTEWLLRDSGGVEVTLGDRRTWGHLDTIDEELVGEDGAGVLAARLSVAVATGTLEGVRQRAAITVDGERYTVREHRREGDGALTRIYLQRA